MSACGPDPSGAPGAPGARPALPARLLAVLVGLLALGAGLDALARWVDPGTQPGARGWLDLWPLAYLVVAAAVHAAGLARRAGAADHALALVAWALAVTVGTELPAAPTSFRVGDGHALLPVYLALALGAGLYAVGALVRHPPPVRAALLLVLFTTANGKLFTRDGELVYPLLAAGVLLALAVHRDRLGWRELARGPAARVALPAALLVAWTLLAAWRADNVARGFWVWTRILTGALLAWTLAGSLDRRGAAQATLGFVVAAACVLAFLAAGLVETAGYNPWSRILGSRWRLFDLHANGIGPQFGLGLCVALGFGLLARGPRRAALLLLALASAFALWRTRSRASLLGAGLGALAVLWAWSGWLPRRGVPLGVGAVAAAVLAVGLLVSPAGDGVRERLEAKTHEVGSAIGQRYHLWEMGAAALADHPWFGLGPGQYYPHTQYAKPSYYDGTAQDLHTHNLFLSVAEGGGWPALVLFLWLLVATYELARVALRSAAERGERFERAAAVALAGGLTAVLGSNLLDLGQSQTTYVPLFLWAALGLLAALCRGAPAERPAPARAGAAGGWVALALAVPLVALPLAGLAAYHRGNLHFERLQAHAAAKEMPRAVQAARAARRWYELALSINPAFARVEHQLVGVLKALGSIDGTMAEALALQERIRDGAPSRAKNWLVLGELYLDLNRPRKGREAILEARRLDPYGPDQGDYETALARSWLLAGQVERAREPLLAGLRLGGSWRRLPQVALPAPDGAEPERGRHVGFGTSPEDAIRFDDLLETLTAEALALAQEDEVRARRILSYAVDGYRAQGRPADALAALERYRERVPERMASLQMIELLLLGELGRVDDAEEAMATGVGDENLSVAGAYTRILAESPDPAHRARAQARVRHLETSDWEDIFFTAGGNSWKSELLASLALERGDFAAALRHHRNSVYDRAGANERVATAQRFFQDTARLGLGDEALLDALEVVLRECSLDLFHSRNEEAMRRRAEATARAWTGGRDALLAAARERCAGLGAAGASFLAALEAELR